MFLCFVSFKVMNCSFFDGIVFKYFFFYENILNYKVIFVKDVNLKMYCLILFFVYFCFIKLCLKDNFIICDSFFVLLELLEMLYLVNK